MSNSPVKTETEMAEHVNVSQEDYLAMKQTLKALKEENMTIKQDNKDISNTVKVLREQVNELKTSLSRALTDLTTYDERHATILSELNGLKESIMDSNRLQQQQQQQQQQLQHQQEHLHHSINNNHKTESGEDVEMQEGHLSITTSQRSIPAPSKVLVDDVKKKDNRLVELRRITREYMNVTDEEAGLRLYKLQKTMIHVVSDLKKYMKERNEDISKSWKSIDISTQRVAFEMVEKEAVSLGVPLNMCIGYWGARRLISKSWANALRTTKKHIKSESKV